LKHAGYCPKVEGYDANANDSPENTHGLLQFLGCRN
jgi:hypothetical protein